MMAVRKQVYLNPRTDNMLKVRAGLRHRKGHVAWEIVVEVKVLGLMQANEQGVVSSLMGTSLQRRKWLFDLIYWRKNLNPKRRQVIYNQPIVQPCCNL